MYTLDQFVKIIEMGGEPMLIEIRNLKGQVILQLEGVIMDKNFNFIHQIVYMDTDFHYGVVGLGRSLNSTSLFIEDGTYSINTGEGQPFYMAKAPKDKNQVGTGWFGVYTNIAAMGDW